MATHEQIGARCDLDRRNVSKYIAKFDLPSRSCDIDEFNILYIKHLREIAAGRKSDNENVDYDLMEERARLSHHQANKTELEEGVLRGDLVPVKQILKSWTNKIAACRAKLLSLPTKSAHVIAQETDVHVIEDLLTDHVHESLDELAGNGLPDDVNRRRIAALGTGETDLEGAAEING